MGQTTSSEISTSSHAAPQDTNIFYDKTGEERNEKSHEIIKNEMYSPKKSKNQSNMYGNGHIEVDFLQYLKREEKRFWQQLSSEKEQNPVESKPKELPAKDNSKLPSNVSSTLQNTSSVSSLGASRSKLLPDPSQLLSMQQAIDLLPHLLTENWIAPLLALMQSPDPSIQYGALGLLSRAIRNETNEKLFHELGGLEKIMQALDSSSSRTKILALELIHTICAQNEKFIRTFGRAGLVNDLAKLVAQESGENEEEHEQVIVAVLQLMRLLLNEEEIKGLLDTSSMLTGLLSLLPSASPAISNLAVVCVGLSLPNASNLAAILRLGCVGTFLKLMTPTNENADAIIYALALMLEENPSIFPVDATTGAFTRMLETLRGSAKRSRNACFTSLFFASLLRHEKFQKVLCFSGDLTALSILSKLLVGGSNEVLCTAAIAIGNACYYASSSTLDASAARDQMRQNLFQVEAPQYLLKLLSSHDKRVRSCVLYALSGILDEGKTLHGYHMLPHEETPTQEQRKTLESQMTDICKNIIDSEHHQYVFEHAFLAAGGGITNSAEEKSQLMRTGVANGTAFALKVWTCLSFSDELRQVACTPECVDQIMMYLQNCTSLLLRPLVFFLIECSNLYVGDFHTQENWIVLLNQKEIVSKVFIPMLIQGTFDRIDLRGVPKLLGQLSSSSSDTRDLFSSNGELIDRILNLLVLSSPAANASSAVLSRALCLQEETLWLLHELTCRKNDAVIELICSYDPHRLTNLLMISMAGQPVQQMPGFSLDQSLQAQYVQLQFQTLKLLRRMFKGHNINDFPSANACIQLTKLLTKRDIPEVTIEAVRIWGNLLQFTDKRKLFASLPNTVENLMHIIDFSSKTYIDAFQEDAEKKQIRQQLFVAVRALYRSVPDDQVKQQIIRKGSRLGLFPSIFVQIFHLPMILSDESGMNFEEQVKHQEIIHLSLQTLVRIAEIRSLHQEIVGITKEGAKNLLPSLNRILREHYVTAGSSHNSNASSSSSIASASTTDVGGPERKIVGVLQIITCLARKDIHLQHRLVEAKIVEALVLLVNSPFATLQVDILQHLLKALASCCTTTKELQAEFTQSEQEHASFPPPQKVHSIRNLIASSKLVHFTLRQIDNSNEYVALASVELLEQIVQEIPQVFLKANGPNVLIRFLLIHCGDKQLIRTYSAITGALSPRRISNNSNSSGPRKQSSRLIPIDPCAILATKQRVCGAIRHLFRDEQHEVQPKSDQKDEEEPLRAEFQRMGTIPVLVQLIGSLSSAGSSVFSYETNNTQLVLKNALQALAALTKGTSKNAKAMKQEVFECEQSHQLVDFLFHEQQHQEEEEEEEEKEHSIQTTDEEHRSYHRICQLRVGTKDKLITAWIQALGSFVFGSTLNQKKFVDTAIAGKYTLIYRLLFFAKSKTSDEQDKAVVSSRHKTDTSTQLYVMKLFTSLASLPLNRNRLFTCSKRSSTNGSHGLESQLLDVLMFNLSSENYQVQSATASFIAQLTTRNLYNKRLLGANTLLATYLMDKLSSKHYFVVLHTLEAIIQLGIFAGNKMKFATRGCFEKLLSVLFEKPLWIMDENVLPKQGEGSGQDQHQTLQKRALQTIAVLIEGNEGNKKILLSAKMSTTRDICTLLSIQTASSQLMENAMLLLGELCIFPEQTLEISKSIDLWKLLQMIQHLNLKIKCSALQTIAEMTKEDFNKKRLGFHESLEALVMNLVEMEGEKDPRSYQVAALTMTCLANLSFDPINAKNICRMGKKSFIPLMKWIYQATKILTRATGTSSSLSPTRKQEQEELQEQQEQEENEEDERAQASKGKHRLEDEEDDSFLDQEKEEEEEEEEEEDQDQLTSQLLCPILHAKILEQALLILTNCAHYENVSSSFSRLVTRKVLLILCHVLQNNPSEFVKCCGCFLLGCWCKQNSLNQEIVSLQAQMIPTLVHFLTSSSNLSSIEASLYALNKLVKYGDNHLKLFQLDILSILISFFLKKYTEQTQSLTMGELTLVDRVLRLLGNLIQYPKILQNIKSEQLISDFLTHLFMIHTNTSSGNSSIGQEVENKNGLEQNDSSLSVMSSRGGHDRTRATSSCSILSKNLSRVLFYLLQEESLKFFLPKKTVVLTRQLFHHMLTTTEQKSKHQKCIRNLLYIFHRICQVEEHKVTLFLEDNGIILEKMIQLLTVSTTRTPSTVSNQNKQLEENDDKEYEQELHAIVLDILASISHQSMKLTSILFDKQVYQVLQKYFTVTAQCNNNRQSPLTLRSSALNSVLLAKHLCTLDKMKGLRKLSSMECTRELVNVLRQCMTDVALTELSYQSLCVIQKLSQYYEDQEQLFHESGVDVVLFFFKIWIRQASTTTVSAVSSSSGIVEPQVYIVPLVEILLSMALHHDNRVFLLNFGAIPLLLEALLLDQNQTSGNLEISCEISEGLAQTLSLLSPLEPAKEWFENEDFITPLVQFILWNEPKTIKALSQASTTSSDHNSSKKIKTLLWTLHTLSDILRVSVSSRYVLMATPAAISLLFKYSFILMDTTEKLPKAEVESMQLEMVYYSVYSLSFLMTEREIGEEIAKTFPKDLGRIPTLLLKPIDGKDKEEKEVVEATQLFVLQTIGFMSLWGFIDQIHEESDVHADSCHISRHVIDKILWFATPNASKSSPSHASLAPSSSSSASQLLAQIRLGHSVSHAALSSSSLNSMNGGENSNSGAAISTSSISSEISTLGVQTDTISVAVWTLALLAKSTRFSQRVCGWIVENDKGMNALLHCGLDTVEDPDHAPIFSSVISSNVLAILRQIVNKPEFVQALVSKKICTRLAKLLESIQREIWIPSLRILALLLPHYPPASFTSNGASSPSPRNASPVSDTMFDLEIDPSMRILGSSKLHDKKIHEKWKIILGSLTEWIQVYGRDPQSAMLGSLADALAGLSYITSLPVLVSELQFGVIRAGFTDILCNTLIHFDPEKVKAREEEEARIEESIVLDEQGLKTQSSVPELGNTNNAATEANSSEKKQEVEGVGVFNSPIARIVHGQSNYDGGTIMPEVIVKSSSQESLNNENYPSEGISEEEVKAQQQERLQLKAQNALSRRDVVLHTLRVFKNLMENSGAYTAKILSTNVPQVLDHLILLEDLPLVHETVCCMKLLSASSEKNYLLFSSFESVVRLRTLLQNVYSMPSIFPPATPLVTPTAPPAVASGVPPNAPGASRCSSRIKSMSALPEIKEIEPNTPPSNNEAKGLDGGHHSSSGGPMAHSSSTTSVGGSATASAQSNGDGHLAEELILSLRPQTSTLAHITQLLEIMCRKMPNLPAMCSYDGINVLITCISTYWSKYCDLYLQDPKEKEAYETICHDSCKILLSMLTGDLFQVFGLYDKNQVIQKLLVIVEMYEAPELPLQLLSKLSTCPWSHHRFLEALKLLCDTISRRTTLPESQHLVLSILYQVFCSAAIGKNAQQQQASNTTGVVVSLGSLSTVPGTSRGSFSLGSSASNSLLTSASSFGSGATHISSNSTPYVSIGGGSPTRREIRSVASSATPQALEEALSAHDCVLLHQLLPLSRWFQCRNPESLRLVLELLLIYLSSSSYQVLFNDGPHVATLLELLDFHQDTSVLESAARLLKTCSTQREVQVMITVEDGIGALVQLLKRIEQVDIHIALLQIIHLMSEDQEIQVLILNEPGATSRLVSFLRKVLPAKNGGNDQQTEPPPSRFEIDRAVFSWDLIKKLSSNTQGVIQLMDDQVHLALIEWTNCYGSFMQISTERTLWTLESLCNLTVIQDSTEIIRKLVNDRVFEFLLKYLPIPTPNFSVPSFSYASSSNGPNTSTEISVLELLVLLTLKQMLSKNETIRQELSRKEDFLLFCSETLLVHKDIFVRQLALSILKYCCKTPLARKILFIRASPAFVPYICAVPASVVASSTALSSTVFSPSSSTMSPPSPQKVELSVASIQIMPQAVIVSRQAMNGVAGSSITWMDSVKLLSLLLSDMTPDRFRVKWKCELLVSLTNTMEQMLEPHAKPKHQLIALRLLNGAFTGGTFYFPLSSTMLLNLLSILLISTSQEHGKVAEDIIVQAFENEKHLNAKGFSTYKHMINITGSQVLEQLLIIFTSKEIHSEDYHRSRRVSPLSGALKQVLDMSMTNGFIVNNRFLSKIMDLLNSTSNTHTNIHTISDKVASQDQPLLHTWHQEFTQSSLEDDADKELVKALCVYLGFVHDKSSVNIQQTIQEKMNQHRGSHNLSSQHIIMDHLTNQVLSLVDFVQPLVTTNSADTELSPDTEVVTPTIDHENVSSTVVVVVETSPFSEVKSLEWPALYLWNVFASCMLHPSKHLFEHVCHLYGNKHNVAYEWLDVATKILASSLQTLKFADKESHNLLLHQQAQSNACRLIRLFIEETSTKNSHEKQQKLKAQQTQKLTLCLLEMFMGGDLNFEAQLEAIMTLICLQDKDTSNVLLGIQSFDERLTFAESLLKVIGYGCDGEQTKDKKMLKQLIHLVLQLLVFMGSTETLVDELKQLGTIVQQVFEQNLLIDAQDKALPITILSLLGFTSDLNEEFSRLLDKYEMSNYSMETLTPILHFLQLYTLTQENLFTRASTLFLQQCADISVESTKEALAPLESWARPSSRPASSAQQQTLKRTNSSQDVNELTQEQRLAYMDVCLNCFLRLTNMRKGFDIFSQWLCEENNGVVLNEDDKMGKQKKKKWTLLFQATFGLARGHAAMEFKPKILLQVDTLMDMLDFVLRLFMSSSKTLSNLQKSLQQQDEEEMDDTLRLFLEFTSHFLWIIQQRPQQQQQQQQVTGTISSSVVTLLCDKMILLLHQLVLMKEEEEMDNERNDCMMEWLKQNASLMSSLIDFLMFCSKDKCLLLLNIFEVLIHDTFKMDSFDMLLEKMVTFLYSTILSSSVVKQQHLSNQKEKFQVFILLILKRMGEDEALSGTICFENVLHAILYGLTNNLTSTSQEKKARCSWELLSMICDFPSAVVVLFNLDAFQIVLKQLFIQSLPQHSQIMSVQNIQSFLQFTRTEAFKALARAATCNEDVLNKIQEHILLTEKKDQVGVNRNLMDFFFQVLMFQKEDIIHQFVLTPNDKMCLQESASQLIYLLTTVEEDNESLCLQMIGSMENVLLLIESLEQVHTKIVYNVLTTLYNLSKYSSIVDALVHNATVPVLAQILFNDALVKDDSIDMMMRKQQSTSSSSSSTSSTTNQMVLLTRGQKVIQYTVHLLGLMCSCSRVICRRVVSSNLLPKLNEFVLTLHHVKPIQHDTMWMLSNLSKEKEIVQKMVEHFLLDTLVDKLNQFEFGTQAKALCAISHLLIPMFEQFKQQQEEQEEVKDYHQKLRHILLICFKSVKKAFKLVPKIVKNGLTVFEVYANQSFGGQIGKKMLFDEQIIQFSLQCISSVHPKIKIKSLQLGFKWLEDLNSTSSIQIVEWTQVFTEDICLKMARLVSKEELALTDSTPTSSMTQESKTVSLCTQITGLKKNIGGNGSGQNTGEGGPFSSGKGPDNGKSTMILPSPLLLVLVLINQLLSMDELLRLRLTPLVYDLLLGLLTPRNILSTNGNGVDTSTPAASFTAISASTLSSASTNSRIVIEILKALTNMTKIGLPSTSATPTPSTSSSSSVAISLALEPLILLLINGTNDQIKLHAMYLLVNFASTMELRPKIIQFGGLKGFAQVLKTSMSKEHGATSTAGDKMVQLALLGLALLTAMEMSTSSVSQIQHVMDNLMQCLSSRNPNIQANAVWVLSNLSNESSLKIDILSRGGVTALQTLLHECLTSSSSSNAGSSEVTTSPPSSPLPSSRQGPRGAREENPLGEGAPRPTSSVQRIREYAPKAIKALGFQPPPMTY